MSKLTKRYQGSATQPHSWFDVRVIYVRVSACPLDDASSPDCLTYRCPPRDIGTALEVNGARISPSEETTLHLRRDRVDCESAETTYVSTDNLRASGSIPFEVLHNEDSILCGTLHKADTVSSRYQANEDFVGDVSHSGRPSWSIECSCSINTTGCVFLKSKHDYTTPMVQPSVEVCIVGRYTSSPVIMTAIVKLTVRRRQSRRAALDAIPEELDNSAEIQEPSEMTDAESEAPIMALQERIPVFPDKPDVFGGFYSGHGLEGGLYGETEEGGEMSWFAAGVRVGVGIGLGMCIGVGIGVGLLVRTYQTTTRSLRRGLLY